MNDKTLMETLKKLNKKNTAKFPVAASVLRLVPFFTEVFSEDEEVLKKLSQLADSNKNAYIRYKTFKPDEIIVLQGDVENTVFWLLKGEARIRSGDKTLARIKPITCFGELTVAASMGRTATVEADKNAEVVEIDWSITQRDTELRDRFLELLLKSTTDKLKTDYVVSVKMWKGARDLYSSCKKRVQELEAENENLRKLNNALQHKLDL
ncbi:MAG: cyclic nucleotide-binding domain-containing protein [Nitrospinae bacterium]|nr:cyclic nucleotide-binding domain-containing protein [Nitrospinota bacterium]MBL7021425.1 cyclic nucleotide-binding domain-containing protein [Nitrospinaceae bacterium]